jgi:hypothetical protein
VSILDHLSSIQWRKSSYSDSSGGACVEVADLSRMIAVRDSKDVDGPVLAFGRSAFRTFVGEIRTGRYDQ